MASKKSNTEWTPELLKKLKSKVGVLEEKLGGKMKAIKAVAKEAGVSPSTLQIYLSKMSSSKKKTKKTVKSTPKTSKVSKKDSFLSYYHQQLEGMKKQVRAEVIKEVQAILKPLMRLK